MQQIGEALMQKILRPYCTENNQAEQVCCSQRCPYNAFICLTKNCRCRQSLHEDCDIKNIGVILKKVVERRRQMEQGIAGVYGAIRKIYIQAIQRLNQDLNNLSMNIISCGLSTNENIFYNLVSEKKWAKIDGSFMYQLKKDLNSKNQMSQKANPDYIRDFWQGKKPIFNNLCDSIKSLGSANSIILPSKITQDFLTIKGFFDKKIKGMKLVFRASEHNFSAKQYHRICDKIPNTITIIKTEFDKVIGGYTPLTLNFPDNTDTSDHSSSSFVFSITNKQKYPLIKSSNAIINCQTYGPAFGQAQKADLSICDKANTTNLSHSYGFPNSYSNMKYVNNQAAWAAFTGATNGYYFKTSQWEVFQMTFDQ